MSSAVRRRGQGQGRVVPRPRVLGEHVRDVQEGERARKNRRLVSYGTETAQERHRHKRPNETVQSKCRAGDHRRRAARARLAHRGLLLGRGSARCTCLDFSLYLFSYF